MLRQRTVPLKAGRPDYRVSKQGRHGLDTPALRHIFRGTACGKDDSDDPELGHHKNAAS